MVRRGSKNVYQKHIFKEMRLRAQNVITIKDSIINIIGGEVGEDIYDHLMSTRIFNLIMNRIFI